MLFDKVALALRELEKVVEHRLRNAVILERENREILLAKVSSMEMLIRKREDEIKSLKIVIKETVLNLEQVISELERIKQ